MEGVINKHPKVQESAVIPVPSELGEDEVKVCVILKPGEDLPPEELIDWCNERLAYFKVPRYIEYRESFPKTATQRVQKHILKKEKPDLTEGCFDMEAYVKKRIKR